MKIKILIVLLTLTEIIACQSKNIDAKASEINENKLDSIVYDELNRSFLLHVPSDYNPKEKIPLVVAVHGYNGSATWYENDCKLSEFADSNRFLVLYPNGLRYPWADYNPRGWNVGGAFEESTGGTDDVGFIDTLIDLVCDNYLVDNNRIYLVGGSLGSLMTFRLAIELECKVAAIATFAGQMIYKRQTLPECNLPVIYLHCDDDPYVSPSEGTILGRFSPSIDTLLSSWANTYSCSSKADTIFINDDLMIKNWKCPEVNMEIKYYKMKRGGHNWPTILNSGVAGNDTIWSFLSRFSKI